MRSCSRGFVLVESMIALLLLAIVLSTFLPAFIIIQNERLAIREQRDAMMLLEEYIYIHLDSEAGSFPSVLTSNRLEYDLFVTEYETTRQFCLSWEGRNNRGQRWCFTAPKGERLYPDKHIGEF